MEFPHEDIIRNYIVIHVILNTLLSIVKKVANPGNDDPMDSNVDKLFNKKGMVNEVKSLGKYQSVTVPTLELTSSP